MFRFSGIFRDVYLYTVPEVHIRDLKIQTELEQKFTKVELVIDMKTNKPGSYQLAAREYDGFGESVQHET